MEVLIDNMNGQVWDISQVVMSCKWKTSRIGSAGSLELKFIRSGLYQPKEFKVENGNVISVKVQGSKVFYGYIFSIDQNDGEEVKVTAYDQIRYLMFNDTYVFKGMTATQIISKLAADAKLKVGKLIDTRYKIANLVEDNKKLLDIIGSALDRTLIGTKKVYVMYDDFGSLVLADTEQMVVPVSFGDKSEATEYKYTRDIDSDTYNRIKIVQDNKKTGKRNVYIAQDSANIAKWGRLQYFEVADEKMNEAQINQALNRLIELKNREQKKLSLSLIGNLKVRAGCYVQVKLDDLRLNQNFLVDSCTHQFEGDEHTMKLELKVY